MFPKLSRKIKYTNFLFSLLLTVIFPGYMSDGSLFFSNSPFALLFLTAIFTLLCFSSIYCGRNRRSVVLSYILGFSVSLMISAGRRIDSNGSIDFSNALFWLYIILFSILYGRLFSALWNVINNSCWQTDVSRETGCSKYLMLIISPLRYIYSHPAAMAAVLLVCWLPCYLGTFPGGFRYDATAELNQLENGYSSNFPLLHSFLITRIVSAFYKLTGSYNAGIAVYTILQMVMFSVMYAHIIYVFYRTGLKFATVTVSFLWCAFFPVIPMLITQTVRDVIFSGLITYTAFWLYLLCRNPKEFLKSVCKPLILSFYFVLTLLARNNNAGTVMLVIIALTSYVTWFLLWKYSIRGAIILALSPVILYLCISRMLAAACQPLAPPTEGASLSVFSQSIVRAYLAEGSKWSDEEIKEISRYIDLNGIVYVPGNADSTKYRLNINGNLSDFLKFWLKIGKRYPGIYLNAVMANTRGMWDPEAVIDGYQRAHVGSYSSADKCYYAFSDGIEQPGTLVNLARPAHEFYKKIGLFFSFEKIPVVSMLFSIGFQFWLVLICFFQALAYKNRRLYLPILVILGYTLISAFVPLVLLRYFAALFFAFPLTVTFMLEPKKVLGDGRETNTGRTQK